MPTAFPLPGLTPGSGSDVTLAMEQNAALPNWVHKAGSFPDQIHRWARTAREAHGRSRAAACIPLDQGQAHASNGFYDPVRERRVLWVWGTLPGGMQVTPREMT
jgi:hypothetical protein